MKLFSGLTNEKVTIFNEETREKEWQLLLEKKELDDVNGEFYLIFLEGRSELRLSGKPKVYAKSKEKKKNYSTPIISNNSLGESTLTLVCSLRPLSPENMGQFSFNASARYGESLKLSSLASRNLSNDSVDGINSICSLIKDKVSDNSCGDKWVLDNILLNFLSISSNKNSGAVNSNLLKRLLASNTLNGLPLLINAENTTLASTTNNIVYLPSSNFSYLLANDKLTSSANSSASFSVNSDLSTIFLILSSLSNFSFNIFPNNNCQFNLEIEPNSLNSAGILTRISSVSMPDKREQNYINLSDSSFEQNSRLKISNKPQEISDFKLIQINEAYSELKQDKEIYLLNAGNEIVKVKSITKVPYKDKIYGVDVENDVILGGNLTSCFSFVKNENKLLCTFSSNKNFILHREQILPGDLYSEFQCSINMLFSQGRVSFNDFFDRGSGLQHLQNEINHNSSSLENGFSMTDLTVNNNVLINLNSHKNINEQEVYKDFELMLIKDASFMLNSGTANTSIYINIFFFNCSCINHLTLFANSSASFSVNLDFETMSLATESSNSLTKDLINLAKANSNLSLNSSGTSALTTISVISENNWLGYLKPSVEKTKTAFSQNKNLSIGHNYTLNNTLIQNSTPRNHYLTSGKKGAYIHHNKTGLCIESC